MTDKLNEFGKTLKRLDQTAKSALERDLLYKPIIERARDIFDWVIPFDMEFYVPILPIQEGLLNLIFSQPPDPCEICGGCYCTICEIFDSGQTLTTLYPMVATSENDYGILITPSEIDDDGNDIIGFVGFTITDPNTIVLDDPITTNRVRICYVYSVEGCTSLPCSDINSLTFCYTYQQETLSHVNSGGVAGVNPSPPPDYFYLIADTGQPLSNGGYYVDPVRKGTYWNASTFQTAGNYVELTGVNIFKILQFQLTVDFSFDQYDYELYPGDTSAYYDYPDIFIGEQYPIATTGYAYFVQLKEVTSVPGSHFLQFAVGYDGSYSITIGTNPAYSGTGLVLTPGTKYKMICTVDALNNYASLEIGNIFFEHNGTGALGTFDRPQLFWAQNSLGGVTFVTSICSERYGI